MSMDIYLPGKQPVRVWWEGDGRYIGCLPIQSTRDLTLNRGLEDRFPSLFSGLPHHHQPVASDDDLNVSSTMARPHTLQKPASTGHDSQTVTGMESTRLVMVTTDNRERPKCGYLVPASPSPSGFCQCIKIDIDKDSLNDPIRFTAGTMSLAFLKQFPVAVSTKQTKSMRWLQDIWKAADFEPPSVPSREAKSPGFAPFRQIEATSLGSDHVTKVVIMLLWGHWLHERVSDSARLAELQELKLHPANRSALTTKIERMELRQRDSSPFDNE